MGAVVACTASVLIFLSAIATTQGSSAREKLQIYIAQQYNKPVYNPESKSYFELRDDNINANWQAARLKAAALSYESVRGRLAVVKSQATHNFLRRNFKLRSDTLIGLRYWCRYRKLQWVTGDFHTRQDFNVWDAQWYRHPATKCGNDGAMAEKMGFMPVYYRAKNYRWQAAGPAKFFTDYLVEYPTGAE